MGVRNAWATESKEGMSYAVSVYGRATILKGNNNADEQPRHRAPGFSLSFVVCTCNFKADAGGHFSLRNRKLGNALLLSPKQHAAKSAHSFWSPCYTGRIYANVLKIFRACKTLDVTCPTSSSSGVRLSRHEGRDAV